MIEVDGIRGHFINGDLEFLQAIVKHTHPRLIAEIGSFCGLSAVAMASAYSGSVVLCHDTWQGSEGWTKEWTEGIDREFSANVDRLGFRGRIHPVCGDSKKTAALYPDGFFDLVFIDGDHCEAGCYGDLVAWYPKCAGAFIGHDRVPGGGVDKATARFVREHHGLRISEIPNTHYMWKIDR